MFTWLTTSFEKRTCFLYGNNAKEKVTGCALDRVQGPPNGGSAFAAGAAAEGGSQLTADQAQGRPLPRGGGRRCTCQRTGWAAAQAPPDRIFGAVAGI